MSQKATKITPNKKQKHLSLVLDYDFKKKKAKIKIHNLLYGKQFKLKQHC